MESWDVYDRDRNKTGKKVKAKSKLLEGQYRLVCHLCIFNSKNELLIQKRHRNKTLYPSMWDLSVSGSVQAGENSRIAISRELSEELGIELSLKDTRSSLTFNFDKGFDDFYLLNYDLELKDLKLQKDEVMNVGWASKEEILKMIDENSFLPYHQSVINLLFFMKDDMRIHTD